MNEADANGSSSVAVTEPRDPAYESVTLTVWLLAPAWARLKSAPPEAVSPGVKASVSSHIAVAVFLPL